MNRRDAVGRRDLIRAGAAAGAIGLAGCAGDGSDAPAFEEGFEDGIDDWEAGAAIGPEVDLADGRREHAFERTTRELSTETPSLAVGTAVIWEADATHYVDDRSVRVEPR
jgi:hypothetical protein